MFNSNTQKTLVCSVTAHQGNNISNPVSALVVHFYSIIELLVHGFVVQNLVEYYYMWKTTDRYVQQKRVKAVESEHKLKQVYVPDYAKLGEQDYVPDYAKLGEQVYVPDYAKLGEQVYVPD